MRQRETGKNIHESGKERFKKLCVCRSGHGMALILVKLVKMIQISATAEKSVTRL